MSHPAEQALAILLGQCDGARARDDCGLNKCHAAAWHDGQRNLDWWVSRLHIYRRQIGDALADECKRYAASLQTGPFVITGRAADNCLAVSVPFARKEEAKEAVLKATGKRALLWDQNDRCWKIPNKFIPLCLNSGAFVESEEVSAEVQALCAAPASAAVKPPAPVNEMKACTDATTLGLKSTLRPFQVTGVQVMTAALTQGGALLADDMGLGKTIQAMAIALHFNVPALVICPANLKYNWVAEVFKHHPTKTVFVHNDKLSPSKRRALFNGNAERFCPDARIADFYIVGYEGCADLTVDNEDEATAKFHTMKRVVNPIYQSIMGPRIAIVDECHYAKNTKAARTQNSLALMRACRRTLAMSGTPLKNRPLELWPILCAIGRNREIAKTKSDFYKEFVERGDLPTLHKLLVNSGWYIRRMKTDVLTELPPKLRGELMFDMPASIAREYEMMRNGLTKEGQTVACQLAILTNLQTIANKAKVAPLVTFLQERCDAEKKTVVSSTRTEPLVELQAALRAEGINCETIDGGTSAAERTRLVQEFQNKPDIQVILTTVQEGLTLTAADTLVLLDLPWTPADVSQREDRIYRIGQQEHVTILRCVAASIDRHKLNIIAAKQEIVSTILDGKHITITECDLQGQVLAALKKEVGGSDDPTPATPALVIQPTAPESK